MRMGAGIHYAISITEKFMGRTEFNNTPFDPFNVEPVLAWHCANVASSFANETKETSSPDEVLGARFLSAIYAVRFISDSPSEHLRA